MKNVRLSFLLPFALTPLIIAGAAYAQETNQAETGTGAAEAEEVVVDYGVLPDNYVDKVMDSFQHYVKEGSEAEVLEPYECSQSLAKDDGSLREVYGYCVKAVAHHVDDTSTKILYFIRRGKVSFVAELYF